MVALLQLKTMNARDLPDRDASFADSHVAEQYDLVVVHILARVVVERGSKRSISKLIVST